MNYKGKIVAVTGHQGFIGSALIAELESLGAIVDLLGGDVRKKSTFRDIGFNHDYLFHFGAPSSQILFQQDPEHCIDVTINGFLNAFRACRASGTKLIYPSTGLLSQNKSNEYAAGKKACEDIARNSSAIGIRIFATYGPGEGHKRDYASVPYLFARDCFYGTSPVVFGTGGQSRDFIFIDDTVNGILELADKAPAGIHDLGSGVATSFNDVLERIRDAYKALSGANHPEPKYIDRPMGYVENTLAKKSPYYTPIVDMDDGIFRMVKSIIGEAE